MIKVEPNKALKHDFKEFEIPESKWNLKIRRDVNRMVDDCLKDKMSDFDAYCEILMLTTKFTEDDIFKLTNDEIQSAGLTIISMMNKKNR